MIFAFHTITGERMSGKPMDYKNAGEYKYFNCCRFCGSKNVKKVIDLGLMPLAGGFIKTIKEKSLEKFYPLELNFCEDCFLLQVNSSVAPDTLFKNYFYFSSSIQTLVNHFEKIAEELRQKLKPKSFIVEIGANDGEFVKSLTKHGFEALGIDPADNVVKPVIKKGVPIINDYFTEKLAQKKQIKYIEENNIRYIIFVPTTKGYYDYLPYFVRGKRLSSYILSNYRYERKINNFLILKKESGYDLFEDEKASKDISGFLTTLATIDLGMIPKSEGLYKFRYLRAANNVKLVESNSTSFLNDYLKSHSISSRSLVLSITPNSNKEGSRQGLTIVTKNNLITKINFNSCRSMETCIINLSSVPLFYRERILKEIDVGDNFSGSITLHRVTSSNFW